MGWIIKEGLPEIGNYRTEISGISENIVTKDDLRKLLDELSKNPLYAHKCQNCGGTVEMDYEKAIFICPYCGSHYALKPHRINDIGGK